MRFHRGIICLCTFGALIVDGTRLAQATERQPGFVTVPYQLHYNIDPLSGVILQGDPPVRVQKFDPCKTKKQPWCDIPKQPKPPDLGSLSNQRIVKRNNLLIYTSLRIFSWN
jgi:hypothetical protein